MYRFITSNQIEFRSRRTTDFRRTTKYRLLIDHLNHKLNINPLTPDTISHSFIYPKLAECACDEEENEPFGADKEASLVKSYIEFYAGQCTVRIFENSQGVRTIYHWQSAATPGTARYDNKFPADRLRRQMRFMDCDWKIYLERADCLISGLKKFVQTPLEIVILVTMDFITRLYSCSLLTSGGVISCF